MQVSIGYDIIENGNRVTGNSKNANMWHFGRQGDTYVVVGQPSDLVNIKIRSIIQLCEFVVIFQLSLNRQESRSTGGEAVKKKP